MVADCRPGWPVFIIMFRIARPGFGFVLSVVAPAVVIFASTVATITYALRDMAREVNRTELSLTSRTAEAAVAATLRRMASTHSDYAVWDDAARRLYGTIDQQFVDEFFVSSTSDPIFFDTVYLVDRNGGVLFAYHNGEASDVPIEQAFSPTIERFVRELPSDGVTYDVRTALVRGVWGLSVIAVGPVVPFTQDFTPRPTAARYLIFGKAFDEAAINRMAEDYLISGLTMTKASGAQTETPLLDPDGKVLAALSWPTRSPGTLALDRLRPRAIEMFILLGALLLGLIGVAARGFVNVRRGEARARHAATHDALSGLPNRSALVDHLKAAMAGARDGERALAILYLDLDGFKEVNDSYGHDVGDLLLRKVAAGFEALAGGQLLVRLGGDEFAVVVDGRRRGWPGRSARRPAGPFLRQAFRHRRPGDLRSAPALASRLSRAITFRSRRRSAAPMSRCTRRSSRGGTASAPSTTRSTPSG